MKLFVLYDKSGIHSGRALGQHLIRQLAGKAVTHRGRPKRLEQMLSQGHRYDYIINVGWFRDFNTGGAKVLNVPEAVRLSSNKRKARVKFNESSISAPKLWLNWREITPEFLPIIARTTHHTKGRGLWFCQTVSQLANAASQGATHFMKFIPNVREFRVHVMSSVPDLSDPEKTHYKVIKVSEKLPRGRAQRTDIVKNHDNGWFFGYPADKKDPALPKVRKVAKKAIEAFGLHWGAVDVMISKDTGEPYVLEINSTPCLTDDNANTLEKYAHSMLVMLRLEEGPNKATEKKAAPSPARPPVRTEAKTTRKGRLRRLLNRKRV